MRRRPIHANRWLILVLAVLSPAVGGALAKADDPSARAGAAHGDGTFVFRDAGEEAGLFPALKGIQGHAAGWGDVDGDGWPELYVGTFDSKEPPKANQFFRNTRGKFRLDEQPALRISTRASGALFADLDNDGDLDLYVSSMPAAKDSRLAQRLGRELRGCTLFRNDGQGKFTNVSEGNGACPAAFGGRSVAALDFDGDGLLDLLVGEDPLPGYNGSKTKSSRLFKNLGELRFEDVSQRVGLPESVPGLGVAAADVNNDTWPDFFLASPGGGNRLYLNTATASFARPPAPGTCSPGPPPRATTWSAACALAM